MNIELTGRQEQGYQMGKEGNKWVREGQLKLRAI